MLTEVFDTTSLINYFLLNQWFLTGGTKHQNF